jgi:hypothetical protein
MLQFLSFAYFLNSYKVFFRMTKESEKYNEKCGNESGLMCSALSLIRPYIDVHNSTVPCVKR